MGKVRRLLAAVILISLAASSGLAEAPMGNDFSLGWKQLIQGYEKKGASIVGTQRISITKWEGLQPETLMRLQPILDALTVQFSFRKDEKYIELRQDERAILNLWQTKDEVWQTVGSSLISEIEGLGIPREEGQGRDEGLARLASLAGFGQLMTHPIATYLLQVTDVIPVTGVFMRQWERLQIAMTPFADEGVTRSGMDGIDAHTHCTTYVLSGADIASALSVWFADMDGDASLLWWLNMLQVDDALQGDASAWFASMSTMTAQMTSSQKLTLRVYLDLNDEVCGITGSTTLKLGDLRIPFSVNYTKKTSGNKVTHSLTLRCQPDGTANGAKVNLSYVTSNNDSDRTVRSLQTTVSGYWNGKEYRVKLSWDYENRWKKQGDGSYAEAISGNGTLNIRYANATVEDLSWSQTQSVSATPGDLKSISIEDSLTFRGLRLAGTIESVLGSNGVQAELQELKEAVSLTNMSDEDVSQLGAQLQVDWDAWLGNAFGDLASLFQRD